MSSPSGVVVCLLCVRSLFLVSCSSRSVSGFMHICNRSERLCLLRSDPAFVLLGIREGVLGFSPSATGTRVQRLVRQLAVYVLRRAAVKAAWHMANLQRSTLPFERGKFVSFPPETTP